jgi:hypothetical protein
MEASTEITGNSQDISHAETVGNSARRCPILLRQRNADGSATTGRGWAASSKKIAAIAALGLAGFLSVTACTTTSPVAAPTAPQSQPSSTPTAQPAVVTNPSPQPDPSSQQVAKYVAEIAVGNGPLPALESDGETATYASCDPATVSNPPDVSTPTTASCDITYSDGSIWQQTVTITYDSQGDPVTASTNAGTELSQLTNQ